MSLILSGTDGLSDVDGSAATPAIRGTDANTGIFFPAADTIAFSEGGVESARIDSAGNFGLGVTPSATWSSAARAIQLGGFNSIFGYTSNVFRLANNAIFTASNETYGASSIGATYYQQYNGAHSWYNAASGTAGNTISFTQAMTLDASGNLGIAQSSPTQKLHVNGNIRVEGATSEILMATGAERTISASGSASSTSLTFKRWNGSSYVSDVTMDGSGNLLVGTNSTLGASGVLQLLGSMDAQAVTRCSAASAGQYWRYGADSGNSFIIYSSNASGGVYIGNASTSWTGRSDERLKDIIEPITNATNKVSSLRAVIGKFKTDEEGTRRSFLIAQDVQAVLPEAVSVSPRKEGEDTDYLGVAYTDVIPLLVAAIKEQQAIITQLQADVAALQAPQGTP